MLPVEAASQTGTRRPRRPCRTSAPPHPCAGVLTLDRTQAEVEAEVWEATCQDVAQISEDEEQMVSLAADR
jgi:hypothetical protein